MKQFKITASIFLEYLLSVMSNNFVSTPNNEDLLRKVFPRGQFDLICNMHWLLRYVSQTQLSCAAV